MNYLKNTCACLMLTMLIVGCDSRSNAEQSALEIKATYAFLQRAKVYLPNEQSRIESVQTKLKAHVEEITKDDVVILSEANVKYANCRQPLTENEDKGPCAEGLLRDVETVVARFQ